MKKLIHIVSMAVLGVILLNGFVRVDAASRTVALNLSNQNNTTSSEMLASNLYPIDYMIVAGDTSRGDIDYKISGRDQVGTYITISQSGTCPVGVTQATTGLSGGTLPPIYFTVDSYVKITILKGTKKNTNSNYYIGSGMIYTPTADVLAGNTGRASANAMVNELAGQADLDICYAEMNRLAVEMRERVNEWDEQNAALMD